MKDHHGVCSLVPAHGRLGQGKQRRHQMSNMPISALYSEWPPDDLICMRVYETIY